MPHLIPAPPNTAPDTAKPPPDLRRFAVFNAILNALMGTLGGHVCVNRLPNTLIGLIAARLIAIRQRIDDIAERLAAGTYRPRRPAQPRTAQPRTAQPGTDIPPQKPPRPRKPPLFPGTLPRDRGWLLRLMPKAIHTRNDLEQLFFQPEMVALLAEAPAAMARPLRSLCWMLRVTPPSLPRPNPRRARPKPTPREKPPEKPKAPPPRGPLRWRGPTRCPPLPSEGLRARPRAGDARPARKRPPPGGTAPPTFT